MHIDLTGRITLCDLKNCKMASIFYNTFFNLDKYLEFEQRDPFASVKVFKDDEKFIKSEPKKLVCEMSSDPGLVLVTV